MLEPYSTEKPMSRPNSSGRCTHLYKIPAASHCTLTQDSFQLLFKLRDLFLLQIKLAPQFCDGSLVYTLASTARLPLKGLHFTWTLELDIYYWLQINVHFAWSYRFLFTHGQVYVGESPCVVRPIRHATMEAYTLIFRRAVALQHMLNFFAKE